MIVVTGVSGLLGINLAATARELGREVVGFYYRHQIQMPGVRVHCIDLTDHRATLSLIRRLKPKCIIHSAAATDVDWREDHPEETECINVRAASFLGATAQELNAQFVYISTDAVFDGGCGNYRESDQPNPLSVYAKSKLRGEQEVLRMHSSALVVRMANIYGWNAQPRQSLGEWFLARISAGRQITGFTDAHFCPILANDSAEMLLAMVDRRLSGIYHLGCSERISKYEFAKHVAIAFDLGTECIVPGTLAGARLRAPRSLDVSLCTEKVRAVLGRQMPSVSSGLRRFRALRANGFADLVRSYYVGRS